MSTISSPVASLDVALLLGDPSELAGAEHSARAAALPDALDAVETALLALGHRPRRLPFSDGTLKLITQLAVERPDVVFHLSGPAHCDPAAKAHVASLLEMLGLTHASESSTTITLLRDKVRAKALLAQHGIASPAYAVSQRGELPRDVPAGPWLVRPSLAEGSLEPDDVRPVSDRDQLEAQVRLLFGRFSEPVLIETLPSGRAFQVGIVGREILPILELDGARRTCPAALSLVLDAEIKDITYKVSRAFGLRRCSRIELRRDDMGRCCVMDVTATPELGGSSVMYAMAKVAGFGIDGIAQRLLDLARTQRSRVTRGSLRGLTPR